MTSEAAAPKDHQTASSGNGTGVGLKNVADRLKARFGEDATCRYGPLANGGFSATIFMPLIWNDR